MYGEGIDRYEAERIANDAARSAADDVRRNLEYDLERAKSELASDIHRLDARLTSLRGEMSDILDEVNERVSNLEATVRALEVEVKTLGAAAGSTEGEETK